MRTRRKLLVLLALVISVFLLIGMTPAAAKKPPKPPPEPEMVAVTMQRVGSEGLTTDCVDGDDDPLSVRMEPDRSMLVGPVSDDYQVMLRIDMDGIEWSRRYPLPGSSGIGFAGCHGGNLDGSPQQYGALFIDLDGTGAVTDLLWHFDYYLEFSDGKRRPRMEVMEHYTLSGHNLQWVDATPSVAGDTNGTVTGEFWMKYHLEDRPNHTSIGYEPFEGSPRTMSFKVIVEPVQ